MEGYARALMEIDAQALQHNFNQLRCRASPARVLAILKANAYGHGLVTIAQALKKAADGFGVACLSEALQLRNAGIHNKIVVLQGAFTKEEYQIASQFQLDIVIHDEYQYAWLMKHPLTRPITIWLKVNTGMNRLGLSFDSAQTIIAKLQSHPSIQSIVLMSHLASADQLDNPTTSKQHRLFNAFVKHQVSVITYSLANSAGLLAWPDMSYHWVRPGLALYGVSPFPDHDAVHYDLRPVMTLKAKIIAIQQRKAGDAIGYYGRFVCQKSMRIGIVAFGYGDGYPYNAPEGTPILLHQARVPLIGQVSMDMLAIDVSTQPTAQLGDDVTLWGESLHLEEISRVTRRSCYELLCGIQRSTPPRVQVKII